MFVFGDNFCASFTMLLRCSVVDVCKARAVVTAAGCQFFINDYMPRSTGLLVSRSTKYLMEKAEMVFFLFACIVVTAYSLWDPKHIICSYMQVFVCVQCESKNYCGQIVLCVNALLLSKEKNLPWIHKIFHFNNV